MKTSDLGLTVQQAELISKIAKRYRLKESEVIVVSCLSHFDGYGLEPEDEGYFLEDYRRFIDKKELPWG